MWNAVGKVLAKLALWCVDHPDQILAVVQTAKSVADAGKAAK